MLGCHLADMSIVFNAKLENLVIGFYQRLVGKLIYLSHTRPDISYAVSTVSQFMQAPSKDHMVEVNKILRYLKATPHKGLRFRKTNRRCVKAYTDSDWEDLLLIKKVYHRILYFCVG